MPDHPMIEKAKTPLGEFYRFKKQTPSAIVSDGRKAPSATVSDGRKAPCDTMSHGHKTPSDTLSNLK